MMLLQYSCYFIVSILAAVKVLSFPQIKASALSGDPGWALNPGAVSSDVTNSNRGGLIASGVAQGQNLWLGDPYLLSHQGGSDSDTLPDHSKDSAFLFDGNDGVTNVAPPTFPNPLRIFFPEGLPQFDPDGITRWFTEPMEPSCDNGKFAFCCQKAPSVFHQRKDRPIATEEQKEEYKRRMKKCRNWSADDPACFFPENDACCDCKSETQDAFECYNPNWRDDPNFQGFPQRPPVLLPKTKATDPDPDPNPSEPSPEQPGEEKQKREWRGPRLFDNKEVDTTATMDMVGMDLLYAGNFQSIYRRPGGRERFESTCSDEYLESKDVRIKRYIGPSLHTPENPYAPPAKLPKLPSQSP